MNELSFGVDADLCTACQLCVVACKDEHTSTARTPWAAQQPELGQFWVRVESLEGGRSPRVQVAHLPIFCQHCRNAPCMKACPEEAIKRRADGLVWIDPEACEGCRLCEDACPYGVIYHDDDHGIAQKCTGCAHRIDEGLLPRCVEMCPHDALTLSAAPTGDAGDVFLPEHGTDPIVRWRGLPAATIAGKVVDGTATDVVVGARVVLQDLTTDDVVELRTDGFGEFRRRGGAIGRRVLVTIEHEGRERFRTVVTAAFGTDLGTIPLTDVPGAAGPAPSAPRARTQPGVER